MRKEKIPVEMALSKLATLCAKGEHCSGEMLAKMLQWGLTENEQAQVMAYLTEHHYIDDERFTRMFVHDKMYLNKWGSKKIIQALIGKRIDKTIYQPILDEIDKKEWKTILLPLLKSKQKSLNAHSDYERDMKLIRYALGRGFTYDVIRLCIDHADDIDPDLE